MSKYLVVVDMQKDFIDGSLGTKEAQAIVPKVIEKVAEFKGPVMFTRDTHEENYLETQEGQNLPVEHCIRGTEGWELQPELNEYALKNHCLIFDRQPSDQPVLPDVSVELHVWHLSIRLNLLVSVLISALFPTLFFLRLHFLIQRLLLMLPAVQA